MMFRLSGVLEKLVILCRWWPAEVCQLSLLAERDVKHTWITGDAEFAVRLFGSGLLYGLHHERCFHFYTSAAGCAC